MAPGWPYGGDGARGRRVNGVHDMGGMHGFGPVERDEATFHGDWEKRVHALNGLVRGLGIRNIDEGRHAIERMAPDAYLRSSYYERWLASLETSLVEKGVLDGAEIAARAERYRQDPATPVPAPAAPDPDAPARTPPRGYRPLPDGPAPRFAPGDRVVARNVHPPGHTRLPRYARGKRGTVDRVHGVHAFPDTNAHGLGPQPHPLYSVRFEAAELWGPSADGPGTVYLDLWESYLEKEDA
jgi:nitrile hydratase beta subunit